METLANRLRKTVKITTPYQKIAVEFKTDPLYVGQIARGERVPKRGKGLKILNALKEMADEYSINPENINS